MKKRLKKTVAALIAALILLAPLCALALPSPEPTKEIAEGEIDISAISDEESTITATVSLYYRYENLPLVAPQTRVITAAPDESLLLVIANELFSGPDAGHPELKPLFHSQTRAISVSESESTLTIIINDAAYIGLSDEPANWRSDNAWKNEILLRRRMALESLALTLTQFGKYSRIMVLVQSSSDSGDTERLTSRFFGDNFVKVLSPLTRTTEYLLSPERAAEIALEAIRQKDAESLSMVITESGRQYAHPSVFPTVFSFAVIGAEVLSGSGSAVAECEITYSRFGAEKTITYPMLLIQDNDIWKVSDLSALLSAID
ncbi:MAG: GerMN domain-containing protein [Eubacteriales bacterium]|nr:GerMN domain-containing protein [Eubacteriales bacterium]MDD3882928.1 GerMN domain-containing protein [Eubacteriales bacterium]MDD4513525.1 GerMN domain-containing protein [Eubacteriales bacterium]